MKKWIALLLALVMCLSLCACGGGDKDKNMVAVKNDTIVIGDQEDEEYEEIELEYDNPITLIDNEIVSVVCTGKFQGDIPTDGGHGMGFRISCENKSDKYIQLQIQECSVDGYMLDFHDGPWVSNPVISPGKKANTIVYVSPERVKAVQLDSLDDFINIDGRFSVMISMDGGNTYSSNDRLLPEFENVLP